MKNILSSILILTQIFWVTPSKAALSNPDKAIIAHNNLLANGGFENGKAGHVATTGVLTIDTTNYIEGKQSGLMTFTSATGDLQYNVASGQNSGMNMTATCKVKTAATSIQFCGMANGVETSCMAVPSNNTWSPMAINFNGPTNGQNVGYKIKNTSASGTITFNADGCDVYTGSTTSVAQAVLFGLVKITGCAGSFQKAAAGSTLVAYAAQTGCSYAVEGNAVADTSFGSTQLPAIKFSSMPAGEYKIEYEGTIGANGASGTVQTNQFTDGTTTAREISTIVEAAVATGQANGISQSFAYTAPKTNVTWQLFSAVSDANNTQVFGTTAKPGVIRVYYFPSQSSQVINPNITPASWSGYHTNTGAWSTTSTASPADVSNATGISLTQTLNRNMGTVTTASGSLPGITFNPPRIGRYGVTAVVGGYGSVGNVAIRVQLADGSNNIIVPPKTATSSSNTAAVTTVLDGIYDATSTSPVTLKVQLSNGGVAGTASIIPSNSGDAAIQWKIIELDAAMPSPILVGSSNSQIYVDGTPTLASTNNKIMIYPSVRENTGSNNMTYTTSATLGDSITINNSGVYSCGVGGGGSNNQGISVNSSALTTSITSLTYAQGRRSHGGSNGTASQYTGYLNSGDIVRPHSDAGGTLGTTQQYFYCNKISN